MKSQFWRRKLMAFLHDPPSKPLDIAGHREVAESIQRRASLDLDEMLAFSAVCDHTAAAADRFPFPKAEKSASSFTGSRSDDTPFRHPLGGSEFFFERPFASADDAEDVFQVCQPGFEVEQLTSEEQDWARFFLHWRRWPEVAASGHKDGDWRTLFLPADTRLPDHNVWSHNSVVSALQGCVTDEGRLSPAFLIFQLGPVQEFIAQARSTRDLWSGSYLLSWLMAHAVRAVTDEVGPDAVIFPALRGQPIFDLLHRDRLYTRINYDSGKGQQETLWERMHMPKRTEEILTPTLPNRFLALVPAEKGPELAQKAEEAIREELVQIGEACWKWFEDKGPRLHPDWRKRYQNQIKAFPKITWQVCPWGETPVKDAVKAFQDLDREGTSPRNLSEVHRLAVEGIPEEDRDGRYFTALGSPDLNNAGFCWSYYYALTDWLLTARRQTRDFDAWTTDENQAGTLKDSFSGVEEIVGDENWWEGVREKHPYLFRSQDRLGAVNLLKRVWHLAYVKEVWQLDVASAVRFESVPAVAAGRWRKEVMEKTRKKPEIWHSLLRVREILIRHKRVAEKHGFVVSKSQTSKEEWFENTDPDCFIPSEWDRVDDREAAQAIQKTLRECYRDSNLAPPPVYFAVLVLDGDEMGKWVSGEKTPCLLAQFSSQTRRYFQGLPNPKVNLAKLQRPLSPSYHLQFSEALANFCLHLARAVVEDFDGQLIYSGGDDVLAMVPAAHALECAEALWMAFRGDKRLADRLRGCEVLGGDGGFVRLTGSLQRNGLSPSWPLVVPGPRAQASVGIAIGHIRSPLQGMVRAAQEAEKRAKDEKELRREACAISLFKRSGEILEWGFKWDSGALDLYREFVKLSAREEPPLSSRFGYVLRELLLPYAPAARDQKPVLQDVAGFPMREVVEHEFHHVLGRQGRNLNDEEKERFVKAARAYLDALQKEGRPLLEDFPRLFDTANFIKRGE